MFKSGYIAIIGRPNVGKSTLLNALLGQKIAGVSPKPQMTRHQILGIRNLPDAQLLFLDTPGIHKPHRSLNEYMMEVTNQTLDDADVFLFMVEASLRPPSSDDVEIYRRLTEKEKPIIVLLNKLDALPPPEHQAVVKVFREKFPSQGFLPVSALHGMGMLEVEKEILKFLPEGPTYYEEDQVTDKSERFIVSEIIREKIMELTQEEVPYSVAIVVEAFQEPKASDKKKITRIRAALVTEKDSQKGILVGKAGSMIKKIGELSRKDIEKQLGGPVFLELFVRVEKDWTKNPLKVREFSEIS